MKYIHMLLAKEVTMINAFRLSLRSAARILTAVFISVLISLALAPMNHAADVVTSAGMIPFSGAVFDPNTSDEINISGWLHVITVVFLPTDPVRPGTFAALAYLPPSRVDELGFDSATGCIYLGVGAGSALSLFPPGPISPPLTIMGFHLARRRAVSCAYPGGPLIPIEFSFTLQLRFTAAGDLIAGESSATTGLVP